ncbi:hypothetical protein [Granulicella mallensis]|uniref:Uncharacterized protein n=1 Tax=Granulicella mallensis (strain ATCC BAA-1857 / DSM 23137 / MP5ACTX8) TaxID=682795 RepID=G8NSK2_GRAMM|nr:hypothetical protein [Granulicella mallensis]AEU38578.1 hypothetical protein AciX8_4303 [Granulicella mallensis MP5ACTX8]
MIRPWLLLARRRLIAAFVVSFFFALFMHVWVSGESLTDMGIFWHHFCGCPVDPTDFQVLLNFPVTAGLVGFFMGLSLKGSNALSSSSNTLFLLTRPVSRASVLLAPLAVATAAVAVFPLLGWLLLLGWLRLVHAPSLLHLLAILQRLPAAAALGPHPRLFDLLSAIEFPRRYLASIALGLCGYTLTASQRWLMTSPNHKLRALGILPNLIGVLSLVRGPAKRISNAIFMVSGHNGPLNYAPSNLSIALHFVFAAAIVFGCWRLLRKVEIQNS